MEPCCFPPWLRAPGPGNGPIPPQPNVRAPSVPRDRKPALAALSLLLVLVGALASVYLQQQSKGRVGVVEITKRVHRGPGTDPRPDG